MCQGRERILGASEKVGIDCKRLRQRELAESQCEERRDGERGKRLRDAVAEGHGSQAEICTEGAGAGGGER